MLDDLAQIQREVAAVATGAGAFSNADTVFRAAPRLVRLVSGGTRDSARDLPDEDTRSQVSAAVDAAIGRAFKESTEAEAHACRVFLLTNAGMVLTHDAKAVGDTTDARRLRQGERKRLATEVVGRNPLPGTPSPAIRLLAWELAYELVNPTAVSRAELLRRIANTARQHYAIPGLEFTELGRAVLDSRGRCVGSAKLKLTLSPLAVSQDPKLATRLSAGIVVEFTEQLEFEGTFDERGEYTIVISTAHGAQENWRALPDCPTIYFMSKDELMEALVKRAETDPEQVFEIAYWPADQEQTTWTQLPVRRNHELEQRLFEAASGARPEIPGLASDQILALTCSADFDNEVRQRLRKTVRLQFPIEDGAIRWRADYPMYLTDIEISRSAMARARFTVRPFWYLAGGRVNPSPRQQAAAPHETITREPNRWILRDHGIALRWDAPPPRAGS